jgi:hypothetical protein
MTWSTSPRATSCPQYVIEFWPGPAGTIQGMTSPEAGLPQSIGAPATRALTAAGYSRLGQLANVPAAELKKLHGVGPKAVRLLQEALERHGMSLG